MRFERDPHIMKLKTLWIGLSATALFASPVVAMETTYDVDQVHAANEVDSVPETVKVTHPVYLESLAGSGKAGLVALAVVIDQMGDIEDIQVLKASEPEFAKPAYDCVRYWRYLPGSLHGRNVKVRVIVPLRFEAEATKLPTTR